jgi:hypothetical protein
MTKKNVFPTQLYNEHLNKLKEEGKEVDIILDVTEEEANWLNKGSQKGKRRK